MAGVAIGSVITIVGTAINGRIARRATAMTLEAEHRQRLWEKQSAAYEETVREVLARQTRRETLTSRGDPGNIGGHPVEEMRKSEEPESVRIRALMLADASAAVWGAYEEARQGQHCLLGEPRPSRQCAGHDSDTVLLKKQLLSEGA